MANKNPSPATRFKPGDKANPSGRSSEAQALDAAFTGDLFAVWRELGIEGLRTVARDNPKAFADIVLAKLPKQSNVTIDQSVTHDHRGLSETERLLGEALGSGRTLPEPVSH